MKFFSCFFRLFAFTKCKKILRKDNNNREVLVESYNHYKNTDIKMRSREATLLRKQLINKCFECEYKSIKDSERDITFFWIALIQYQNTIN